MISNTEYIYITSTDQIYLTIVILLKSKLLSRESKVKVFVAYIRPILAYVVIHRLQRGETNNKLITFEKSSIKKI